MRGRTIYLTGGSEEGCKWLLQLSISEGSKKFFGIFRLFSHEDTKKMGKELNRKPKRRQKMKKYAKKYGQTIKGKENAIRQTMKRRKRGWHKISFGFQGCVWHHVNENDVVACVEKIHQKFSHSVKDGSALRIEGVLG